MNYNMNRILILASVLLLGSLFVSPAGFSATYERTYTVDADFAEGVCDGVNYDTVPDQIQLSIVPTTFAYAWIANSGEGTISKIDTTNGQEVARYRTGPGGGAESPSRTAIDILGNCWVANRGTGTVIKILAEGGVNTSTGPADVRPWGTDDRVVLSVLLGSSSSCLPRAMAIDKNGNVWVGLYNESRYAVVDSNTGAVLAYVPTVTPPYGAAIDKNGILWSASLGWGIEKVDTNTRTSLASFSLGGGYGIAVDADGIVWEGAYGNGGVNRFDPVTSTNQYIPSAGATAGRGVCVAPNGNVWVALGYGSPNHNVAKYDKNGNLLAVYDNVGNNPCGVGTDFDGNILVVCQDTSDVYKLNEADGSLIWRVPVGATPYTYSDFTGYAIRNLTQKTGTWTTVFDSGLAGMAWGKASYNCSTPGASLVGVQVRAADSTADLASQSWLTVLNDQDFGPINGQFIETKARLTTTTEDSPVLYDITVRAANHPPDCGSAYPSVAQIWPPNHKMVAVNILGVVDPDNDPVTITIDSITQDEPTNGLGDGDTPIDGAGIGTGTAQVRAERSGKGDGRVYVISFTASDSKGGTCSGKVSVCVPKDMKPGTTCIDGGRIYDSTK